MVHVDIGEAQSCAAHRSGKVTCRGSGRPAMVVTGLQDVVEVAARDTRPCARTSRGEVWCWRYDSGDPPERLDDRNDALQLADSRHSGDLFVLRGDGTVTRNSLDGSTRTIADVSDAVGVAAGGLFACILHAHGGASCIDELEDTPTLRPVTDSHDLAQLVVGGREVCGVTRAGAVRCWKAGIDTPQLDPWDASLRLPGVRLAAGHEFACALTGDGAVDCWGRPPWPANGPRVEGLSGVTDLFAGPRQVCARKSDESMWCWGDDLRGQIGDGQLPREFGTTRISGVQALAAGPNVTCAAAKDGPVRCWAPPRSGPPRSRSAASLA